MCFLKPLKVKKVDQKIIVLENKQEALVDPKVGKIKPGDLVLVFGNLVVEKVTVTSARGGK